MHAVVVDQTALAFLKERFATHYAPIPAELGLEAVARALGMDGSLALRRAVWTRPLGRFDRTAFEARLADGGWVALGRDMEDAVGLLARGCGRTGR